ncbi:TRAP transporter large permease [Bradyrhizobium sp. DASA03005]|uniref:TRAP transporter large permease n=1 Tax=Bradyrhizobium sp. SPXBL-02 TaxID=3395912 RepID=UPI003F71CD28
MTDPQLGISMLIIFIFLIVLGFPIAFTLMAMGVSFGFYAYYVPGQELTSNRVFTLLVQKAFEVSSNDVLISVPVFTFMGYIIDRANILDRMFRALQLAIGGLPGSLALATMVVCALWGIASGIVGAVVVLMGLLAMPAMLRAGYDNKLASGVICAGGTLGILIPPSVMLILYAATAGISPIKLYLAAFIPGFGLTAAYLVYIMALATWKPELAPKLPKEERSAPLGTVLYEVLVSFMPLTILTFVVLAVIFAGLATPTESAAIGAFGALLLAIGYGADYSKRHNLLILRSYAVIMTAVVVWLIGVRYFGLPRLNAVPIAAAGLTILVMCALLPNNAFTMDKLRESVFLTARTTAMVCWLFVGSAIFSSAFALLGGQAYIEQFVVGLGLSAWQFMLVAQLIIFLLGWPLEWTEIIIIFLPIFLPLLKQFGIDPLFFGVMVALNLQTSFLSPPVAMAPFYLKGVAPSHVTINQIFSGVMPYIWIVVAFMVLMYIFPGMALWLPNYWSRL